MWHVWPFHDGLCRREGEEKAPLPFKEVAGSGVLDLCIQGVCVLLCICMECMAGRWSQYRIAVVMGVIVVMQVVTVMIIHDQSTRLIPISMGDDRTRSEHEARHDFNG